ncbi:MAG: TPM domain-containing protein, partial [Ruminiclostridium sp.]|nr:TPM domain-containing protein [Ruminiclostridium sp.]
MMKRITALASAIITALFVLCASVCADGAVGMVYDAGDIFTDSQEDALREKAYSAASTTGLNVVIYTTADVGTNKSDAAVMDYADVRYEELCGMNTDGILLLINNDTNFDWISTSGSGINYFSDYRIENIFSAMDRYYKKDDLYGAALCFIEKVEFYCSQGKENNQQEVFGTELDLDYAGEAFTASFVFVGFIALIASFILYSHYAKQYAISKPDTRAYTLKDSLWFSQKTDTFVGNITSRIYSPRSSSSSGSHSGGHSH